VPEYWETDEYWEEDERRLYDEHMEEEAFRHEEAEWEWELRHDFVNLLLHRILSFQKR